MPALKGVLSGITERKQTTHTKKTQNETTKKKGKQISLLVYLFADFRSRVHRSHRPMTKEQSHRPKEASLLWLHM